jgi:hypothetical protein
VTIEVVRDEVVGTDVVRVFGFFAWLDEFYESDELVAGRERHWIFLLYVAGLRIWVWLRSSFH